MLTSLLKSTKEAREIRKQIRKLDKELALLGYIDNELNPRVQLNLDFARSNMKQIIYDQAILEGIATTFPDTETIIENGKYIMLMLKVFKNIKFKTFMGIHSR